MSWGFGPWGATPWGGLLGGTAIFPPILSFVNSRPFPPLITQATISIGGTNNLVLSSTGVLAEAGAYNDFYLFYIGAASVVSRKIQSYAAGYVCTLEYDLPVAIPALATVLLISPDEWVPDLVAVSVRPSAGRNIDPSTLKFMTGSGKQGMDGIRKQVLLGNPVMEHRGWNQRLADAQTLYLDDTAAGPPAGSFNVNDAFKGLVVEITRGLGQGQIRRIVRYEQTSRIAHLDYMWDTVPNASSEYRAYTDPSVHFGLVVPPYAAGGTLEVDASLCGLWINKPIPAGNPTGLLCVNGSTPYLYQYDKPILLYTQFSIISATLNGAGRCGIGFGFYVHGSPYPLGVYCEVMHDGVDLIMRVRGTGGFQDFVLLAGAAPGAIAPVTYNCQLVYDPVADKFHLDVIQVTPYPGTVVIHDGIINAVVGGLNYTGCPVYTDQNSPCSFFGTGIVDSASMVQFTSFGFMDQGVYEILNGTVQHVKDATVFSALPNRYEPGKKPLDWYQPWLPAAGGRKDPPGSIRLLNTKSRDLSIQRITKEQSPYCIAREEPALYDLPTNGFLMQADVRITATDHDPYDVTGAAMGVVLGEAGTLKLAQLTFIEDFGTPMVGFRVDSPGLFIDQFLAAKSDWTSFHRYRFIYDPAMLSGEQYIAIHEDDNAYPILLGDSTLMPDLLAAINESPLDRPGFYAGLVTVPSKVKMEIAGLRYLFNLVSYFPQLYKDDAIPTTPDMHLAYPWLRFGLIGPTTATANYTKDYTRAAITNGRMKLTSLTSAVYYYRNLDAGSVDPAHVFRTDNGFVMEFRMRLEAFQNRNTGMQVGFWSGVGAIADDGVNRFLVGFSEAGFLGRYVFIAGTEPDTGIPLPWASIQTWVTSSMRDPARWRNHVAEVDWTQEHLYRLEISRGPSGGGSRVSLYLDDNIVPIINLPYQSGKFMDGADALGSLGGSTPRVVWGNLENTCSVVSHWREVLYAVSLGYDVHVNHNYSAAQRGDLSVYTTTPTMTEMSVLAEET